MARITREELEQLATVHLAIEDEHEAPEDHFASDEPGADEAQCEEIRERLERGDTWAWGSVRVWATVELDGEEFEGSPDHLGCCSYDSERDFKEAGDYWPDMRSTALDNLFDALPTYVKAESEREYRPGVWVRGQPERDTSSYDLRNGATDVLNMTVRMELTLNRIAYSVHVSPRATYWPKREVGTEWMVQLGSYWLRRVDGKEPTQAAYSHVHKLVTDIVLEHCTTPTLRARVAYEAAVSTRNSAQAEVQSARQKAKEADAALIEAHQRMCDALRKVTMLENGRV